MCRRRRALRSTSTTRRRRWTRWPRRSRRQRATSARRRLQGGPAVVDNSSTGSAGGLDELYREIILEHYRSPKRKRQLDAHNRHADGSNPLCGDQIEVEAQIDGDTVTDVGFVGQGCSISQASASLMSDYVAGKRVD